MPIAILVRIRFLVWLYVVLRVTLNQHDARHTGPHVRQHRIYVDICVSVHVERASALYIVHVQIHGRTKIAVRRVLG